MKSANVVRLPVMTIEQHKRVATKQAKCYGHDFSDKWKYFHGGGVGAYERYCSKCGALLRLEIDNVFGRGEPTAMGANLSACTAK